MYLNSNNCQSSNIDKRIMKLDDEQIIFFFNVMKSRKSVKQQCTLRTIEKL